MEEQKKKPLIEQLKEKQEPVKGKSSIELLKSVFGELFYGKKEAKENSWLLPPKSKVLDTEELPYKLEDRLLPGYWYTLSWHDPNKTRPVVDTKKRDARDIMIQTGRGGVQMYVDTCRKDGMPDNMIVQSIWVYVKGRYVNINHVNVVKTDGTVVDQKIEEDETRKREEGE